jgi:hypothetical protein
MPDNPSPMRTKRYQWWRIKDRTVEAAEGLSLKKDVTVAIVAGFVALGLIWFDRQSWTFNIYVPILSTLIAFVLVTLGDFCWNFFVRIPRRATFTNQPLTSLDGAPEGAVTATQVVLASRESLPAPFIVTVEFDDEYIEGGGRMPQSGFVNSGSRKIGRFYQWQVAVPSLIAGQQIIITAYSKTDKPPNAVFAHIRKIL